MIKTDSIPLSRINLWDENSRLPGHLFNADQKKLVATFLSNEKKFKVRELAREIVKDFDLPQLERVVVFQEDKTLTVYEGNRRLIAYKCLANPELAGEYQAYFEGLKKQIDIDSNFLLDSIVTDNIAEANRYIERKHVNGNGEVNWSEHERHTHDVRMKKLIGAGKSTRKSTTRVSLGQYVENLDIPENMKRSLLGEGYVTNFYRIVDSTSGRKHMHYHVTDDGEVIVDNAELFNRALKIFAYDLLTKREFKGTPLGSRALNTSDEIDDYFASLGEDDVIRVEKGIAQQPLEPKKSKTTKPRMPKTTEPTSSIEVSLEAVSDGHSKFRINSIPEALEIIKVICHRFNSLAAKMQSRRAPREPLLIQDEYDVQYLLAAILEVFFDNVRPEEWTPSYLGGAKRVDFYLPAFDIFIEVKMTRPKLEDKELGAQLAEDLMYYKKHPKCKNLICFVYNPGNYLKNKSTIVEDVQNNGIGLDAIALIEP